MSFSRFLTDVGTIQRLTPTVSSGRTIEAWVDIEYNVPLCIQPGSEELIALGQGDFYNTFSIYAPWGTDIHIGDKALVGSVDFLIQGVQDRPYGISQKHLKLGAVRK